MHSSPGADPASDRRAVRAAAKRSRHRRGLAVATASTVLVLGAITSLVVSSPGWDNVQQTFFSWEAFRTSFPDVLDGFWMDVKLFLVVEVIVLVVGLAVALCRVVRIPSFFPVRLLAAVYVDVFRGVPTILVVYLIGFGVPALNVEGLPTDPFVLGGFALALSYGAYVSEVYRAGIESIHPSQRVAALALGLSGTQSMRHVVVPQAVSRVAPPLLNDFIALQKDVALVSILGPLEAFRVAQIHAGENFNYTPLIAAALLYLCVTFPFARVLDRMQSRSRRIESFEVPA